MSQLSVLAELFQGTLDHLLQAVGGLTGSASFLELRDRLRPRLEQCLALSLQDIGVVDVDGESSEFWIPLSELQALADTPFHSGVQECRQISVELSELIRIAFSDGSLMRRYGRLFTSCSSFWGVSSPLNRAITLDDIRSSMMAELRGVDLTLTVGAESGVTRLCICLDNVTSIMLAKEAVRSPVLRSSLLQFAVRSNPGFGDLLDRIHRTSQGYSYIAFVWARGHCRGHNFWSMWNSASDRLAQERSSEDARLFAGTM